MKTNVSFPNVQEFRVSQIMIIVSLFWVPKREEAIFSGNMILLS